MREVGRESWGFRASTPELLHHALFVRDACRLPVPPGDGVPPPLAGPVPDRRPVLADPECEQAGADWTGWWQSLLGDAAVGRDGETAAPPDFDGLADRPALQKATVALHREAGLWAAKHLVPAGQTPFEWSLMAEVATDVAFDRGVGVGRVNASALVLDVQGPWWALLSPGVVVCSRAAASDRRTGHLILRRAFESGLSGARRS